MIFLTLLIFPLLIAAGFFIFGEGNYVTTKEFAVQVLAQFIVAGISVGVIYHVNTGDIEVWNGKVAKKIRERVSCSHSYSCNCYESCSGTGKNRSCTEICQTCYDHSYDVDWYLVTTNQERIYINRVDRQGLTTPPRWTTIVVGEPTAVSHEFENYIKGAPNTLFKKQGLEKEFQGQMPNYPRVYDYYHFNHVLGLRKPEWQKEMNDVNAELGALKEVNIMTVVTNNPSQKYGLALEQHWLGGKKNDVVVVIGINKQKEIMWSYVFGWAKNNILNIKMRDSVLDLKTLTNPQEYAKVVKENIKKYYQRKSMEEYAYLKNAITPTKTQWIVSMLIGFFVSVGLGVFFYKQDVFQESWKRSPYRRF